MSEGVCVSSVIHRSTGEFRPSVNTPDYSPLEWIINPDLSNVSKVPQKYWKVVGEAVVEMTSSEKTTVDNPPLPPAKTFNSVNDALGGPKLTGISYI